MNCPSCGHPNPEGSRFCNECGAPLDASAKGPPVETPEHLAEKIRSGGAALAGERKQVTVMFADVQGSMELAERTDPEALRRIMERFFAILCEGVHRFEGTVDKFTGDGIMALFGAPIAHEDHARRACYAALHLREELAKYADELRRSEGLNFSVRMGLNSGEVVVGSIGEDLTLDYTAIGHTVGLAQRMEQLAAPDSAYLTEHAATLVEGFFELRDLGEFDVKGVSRPIGARELMGIGTARTRLEVSRERGFSRFVGRVDEMDSLEDALQKARDGQGSVVGIVGEPGVGKSRLCYEFAERCRGRAIPVYEAAALAHARTVPLLPALQLMRNYFEIEDAQSDRAVREKVAGRLLLLDPGFADDLPLVFEFLGVPDPERPAPRIDPEARKLRLIELIRMLVEAQSEREPGVTLIEDLHWIDPSSDEFLAGLVAAIRGTRTLLVLNFRPEYSAQWMASDHYTALEIEPLGEEAVGELLADLLGSDPSLDGLAELIQERTRGNPFFVEEVVQELVESGMLSGKRGAYRLSGTIEQISVPNTVQSVLAARIDRLPEAQKSVLQAAAVIGREFAGPVLAHVARATEGELEPTLAALVEAEFVYPTQLYPEPEHGFKHPLTQEVAYGSLLAERRRPIHAAAATAIAEQSPERADERAALIASHWEAADEPLQAARWHARAATWAGFKDPGPTLDHWSRVRELVNGLPEDDETAQLDATSRLMSIDLGWRLGMDYDHSSELAENGIEAAKRRGDTAMLALFHLTYGTASSMKGRVTRAAELHREALRLADETGDPAMRLAVRTGASYVFFMNGLLKEALREVEVGIEIGKDDPSLARGLGVTSPYAFCEMFRGGLLSNLGRLDESGAQLEWGMEVARREEDLEAEAWAYSNGVHLAWSRGEPETAVAQGIRGIESAERIGDVFTRSWAHTWLGVAYHLAEEWERGIEELETALEMTRSKGTALDTEPWRLAWLGDCYGKAGDPDKGMSLAEEGLRLCEQRGAIASEGVVQWVRARLLMEKHGADAGPEVRQALEAAIANARRTGYRPALSFDLLDYAELARLEGDAEERQRILRAAREEFKQMGATGWLRRTDELLGAPA
jgi:class 3 adenylate cyclase/tetratricopeptide (TPR) repeat protein